VGTGGETGRDDAVHVTARGRGCVYKDEETSDRGRGQKGILRGIVDGNEPRRWNEFVIYTTRVQDGLQFVTVFTSLTSLTTHSGSDWMPISGSRSRLRPGFQTVGGL
jgi:hypothetical protein